MAKRNPSGKDNRKTMEHNSFRLDDDTNEVWRAVTDGTTHDKLDQLIAASGGGGGGGGPLAGVIWDSHSYSVASNVETYRFYEGGLTGTLKKTATLTYEDDTLCVLVSSEWT